MKALSTINTARVDAVHTPTITRLAGGRREGEDAAQLTDGLDKMDATPTPRKKTRSPIESLRRRLAMRTPSPPKEREVPTSARVTPPSPRESAAVTPPSPSRGARRVRVLADATNASPRRGAPASKPTAAPRAAVEAAPPAAAAAAAALEAEAAVAGADPVVLACSLAFWGLVLVALRMSAPEAAAVAEMSTAVVVAAPPPAAAEEFVGETGPLLLVSPPALPLGLLASKALAAFLEALFLPMRLAVAAATRVAADGAATVRARAAAFLANARDRRAAREAAKRTALAPKGALSARVSAFFAAAAARRAARDLRP